MNERTYRCIARSELNRRNLLLIRIVPQLELSQIDRHQYWISRKQDFFETLRVHADSIGRFDCSW